MSLLFADYSRSGILCDDPRNLFSMLVRAREAQTKKENTSIFYFGFSRESELMEWFRLFGAVMNLPTITPFITQESDIEIKQRLGSGSFGTVFSGNNGEHEVAIKFQKVCESTT